MMSAQLLTLHRNWGMSDMARRSRRADKRLKRLRLDNATWRKPNSKNPMRYIITPLD
jgi:hypothetical protein